jgi:16S rRNA (guanine527-N7)-methyltransferase|tara:strand:+ start:123 stop:710 length:588 start_codon:yes stop_codon:yes gene_type:complete
MHDSFTTEQKKKIITFINLALTFNKTHNIFSRKSHNEVYEKDILDCLPLIEFLKKNDNVLDLGTGGGFPGILLSIAKPSNQINLLEKNKKKCYFLKIVIDELKLKNTRIVNKTIAKQNTLGKFDIITARAFASIKKIINLTINNTHQNSKYILLKGKKLNIKSELRDIDINKLRYEIIKQEATTERNIVLIENDE